MPLPKTVTMTKEGGRFWRAQAYRWCMVGISLPFVAVSLVLAVVNPFWFRDDMFNWVERSVRRFTRYINLKMYTIYLGCDPEVWHALKD